MQKNASLLAIVAVHTAENEPSEVGDVGEAEASSADHLIKIKELAFWQLFRKFTGQTFLKNICLTRRPVLRRRDAGGGTR